MSQEKYWVWLSSLTGVSLRKRHQMLERFGGAEAVFRTSLSELAVFQLTAAEEKLFQNRKERQADELLARCEEQGIRVITMMDSAYPNRLKYIADPPLVLYVKGRLPEIDDEPVIALIGTRKASFEGLRCATRFGADMALSGAVVATGLTFGIEETAAVEALRQNGRCIAVLGTPHPKTDRELQREVMRQGAVISEYPPGAPQFRSYFRARNRITSGISLGTVVIEAPAESGALKFAQTALEQGRDVFAVPGRPGDESCAGSNRLLREGAQFACSAWEVLQDYAARFPDKLREPQHPGGFRAQTTELAAEKSLRRPRKTQESAEKAPETSKETLHEQLEKLTETQLKIIAAIEKDGRHADDIIEETGLPAPTVLAQLTMLEILGCVQKRSGGRYHLRTAKK